MSHAPLRSLGLSILIGPALLAQIVAAPNAPAANQPGVGAASNQTPLVQIAAPNSAGLSNNHYGQFNVDGRGAILNNAQAEAMTQLGGAVAGNPALAAGSAGIILNQVVGLERSVLAGQIEVAGQRADVIIANPNGITCNGAGFINTQRSVLTTGVPVLGANGGLEAFRVTGGQLELGEGGLKVTDENAWVDLIARSVKVNGHIRAQGQLNVITGANLVDYANQGVTVLQDPAGAPAVGIDVSKLGGMYAHKIRLLGTEKGMGVNHEGELIAQLGGLTLTQEGRVDLSGTTRSGGDLHVVAQDGVAVKGKLSAQGAASIRSHGEFRNNGGSIESQNGNLDIQAGSMIWNNNSGVILAQAVAQREEGLVLIQPSHLSQQFLASDLTPARGHDGVDGCFVIPAGLLDPSASLVHDYTRHTVTRTTSTPSVLSSAPGRIVAGNDLTLSAPVIQNNASELIAGHVISTPMGAIQNQDHQATASVVDQGSSVSSSTAWRGGGVSGGHRIRRWTDASAYNPAPRNHLVPMGLCVVREHAAEPNPAPAMNAAGEQKSNQ